MLSRVRVFARFFSSRFMRLASTWARSASTAGSTSMREYHTARFDIAANSRIARGSCPTIVRTMFPRCLSV